MWNIEAFSYHKNAHKNEFLIRLTVTRTRTCKILLLTVSPLHEMLQCFYHWKTICSKNKNMDSDVQ